MLNCLFVIIFKESLHNACIIMNAHVKMNIKIDYLHSELKLGISLVKQKWDKYSLDFS